MSNEKAKRYAENRLKPPKAFWEWCYSQIPVYEWSNKKQTILSSDRKGAKVIRKRLAKNSNLDLGEKVYFFGIILVTSKRIEIQSYSFWSNVVNGKQSIDKYLENIEIFTNDEHIKVTKSWSDQYYFGLTKQDYWTGCYTLSKFYPNNWEDKVQQVSELKYLEIDSISYWDIENFYKYKTEIEFLQKINAKAMANEVMHPQYSYDYDKLRKNTDMRVINQNWLKKNKQFFKNSDRTFLEFEFERKIKERGGKVVPGIEEFLDFRDINKIPKGVGMVRFQNWIIKNKVNFDYYKDYLRILVDLKIPIDSENLIIPKDLVKAHNNAVELLNQLKRDELAKEFEKQMKLREGMERTVMGYHFILPKDPHDLVAEGKALHHCVGSSGYVEGHSKGKTTIVFIRKKEDESFFTLEFKNGKIRQLRGKHNINPPEDVKKASEMWEKIVIKKPDVKAG